MPTKPYRHLPAFTTQDVCEIADISPRGLQLMLLAKAVVPVASGGPGRGRHRRFSVQQTVAVAYGASFLAANCVHSWAYAATSWVAAQHPGALIVEFAQGKTLLALLPHGKSRLVEPYLEPQAGHDKHLLLSQLDLSKCYWRVLKKATERCFRLSREEQELAEKLAKQKETRP